jgi:RNA polymerase sigma factor (sigma-70 family)
VSDYVAQIKIKNGPMLRAMRRRGFMSANALAKAAGVNATDVGRYLALKKPAYNASGDYHPTIIKISQTLRTMPCDLFPPQHLERPLKISDGEIDLSFDEVREIVQRSTPEIAMIETDNKKLLEGFIRELPERQKEVIEARIHNKPYHEIAKGMGISTESVRQLERKATRGMRHKASIAKKQEHLEVLT